MPSKSPEQKRLMDAAAHNPAFAKKVGIPVSVAKEFSKSSKGMKFGTGTRPSQQGVNKPKTNRGESALFAEGGTMKDSYKAKEMRHVAAMKKAGVPKKIVAEEMKEAQGMKKGGKASCYARGGGIEQRGKTRGKMV